MLWHDAFSKGYSLIGAHQKAHGGAHLCTNLQQAGHAPGSFCYTHHFICLGMHIDALRSFPGGCQFVQLHESKGTSRNAAGTDRLAGIFE